MSNVRPRASQMRSTLVHTVKVHRSAAAEGNSSRRLVEQQLRCVGVGRPSFGGRRTGLSCHGFSQRWLGLSVLWRPAHRRFGSGSTHKPNGGVCSAAVPSLGPSVKRSLSSNSLSRAATQEENTNTKSKARSFSVVGAGALVCAVAKQATIRARSVLSHARPNPSIERTSSSKLRLPPAAAHVKR